jgi:DNA uptake protein ComE-like DNA-binding protein
MIKIASVDDLMTVDGINEKIVSEIKNKIKWQ